MYLDAIILNHNRKERLCKECKEPILPRTDNIMLMCRGKKGGRYYVYVHPPCILPMLWKERERRRVKDPKAAGRPVGSALALLSLEEQGERHRLIRARARLLRLVVAEESLDEVCALLVRTRKLKADIEAILPLQVESPGHRSKEATRILQDKIQAADRKRR